MFYRQIAIDAVEKTVAAANSSGMIKHPGLKGRLREIVVQELITPFLNPHIRAATGTIVDPQGTQSRQIDVILYDEQVTPPVLFSQGEGIIPCHAVVATIEVKSTLTRTDLEHAITNARSVKTLQYDYETTPFSGEIGFRRVFEAELLKLIPESSVKPLLEQALTTINSPASYVFAFRSDLAAGHELNQERFRLQELVCASNKGGVEIKIPISGLCIADREFLYCDAVEPVTNSPSFSTVGADFATQPRSTDLSKYWASHDVVLQFIAEVVNTCSTYSSQRWRIPLEVYFKPSSGKRDD